jgi:hypothetical protein
MWIPLVERGEDVIYHRFRRSFFLKFWVIASPLEDNVVVIYFFYVRRTLINYNLFLKESLMSSE